MRILVNPRPQLSVNSSSVCAGDSATLTATGNANSYSWSPVTGLSNTTGLSVKASPGNTTIYTVTGTITTTGCQNTAQGTVTIKPIPSKPSISLSGNQLVSSSNQGNQWFLNGTLVAVLTTATITPPTSGFYTLQVTINGCASPLSDPYNFIYTGQPDLNVGERLALYPNPVKDEFYLDYYLNELSDKVNVRVLNSDGRVVKEFRQIISRQNLFAGDLAAGVYLLQLETKSKRMIQLRFVKTN
jgi:hypothetical protein